MTLRREIGIGCTLSSCSMFMVYYYSNWLYIIEILTYFNVSRDIRKVSGKLFIREDGEQP